MCLFYSAVLCVNAPLAWQPYSSHCHCGHTHEHVMSRSVVPLAPNVTRMFYAVA